MRDLNHDFKNLCQRNRDGSLATQHDRESILSLIANQLDEDGFRHLRKRSLANDPDRSQVSVRPIRIKGE